MKTVSNVSQNKMGGLLLLFSMLISCASPDNLDSRSLKGALEFQDVSAQNPIDENSDGISVPRYFAGGLLSITPGFGLGHIVQERWIRDGMPFTFLPLGFLAYGQYRCSDLDHACLKGLSVATLGILSTKIWEIIDAWGTPQLFQGRLYVEPPSNAGEIGSRNKGSVGFEFSYRMF